MKAKSDIDFSWIDLSPVYNDFRSTEVKRPKQINGFDTETADGELFLISYAFEGFSGQVIQTEDGKIPKEEVFNILTHAQCRGAHNMWFNLAYDAEVLVSHVLNNEEMEQLRCVGTVETSNERYQITYIRGKFLEVKDREQKHSYIHYDASQFFFSSLDGAAKEYLDENKVENIDAEKFGLNKYRELNDYIQNNMMDIMFYAKRDAELVRDLWVEFVDIALEYDMPIERPYSTGYFGQMYLENHINKPSFVSKDLQKFAWQSYQGGRFEIFQRGSVGDVVGVDISSAYPYWISKLPDPTSLHWSYYTDCEYEDIEKGEYGFVNLTVSTKDAKVQPFGIKTDKRIYPKLDGIEVTVTLWELQTAVRHNLIEEMEIHSAAVGTEFANTRKPFEFIQDLYHKRKTQENEYGNMLRGLLLKIVMNSIYGKFIQTTPKRYNINYDGSYEYKEYERPIPSQKLPESLQDELVVEVLEAGKCFNPFIASHITAGTRVQLLDFIHASNLEDELVMYATDCVMLQDNFDRDSISEYLIDDSMSYRDKLGKWEVEYEGDAFVVGAGMYEIDGEKSKVKTRGFRPKELADKSIRAHLAKHGEIDIQPERPISMGLALHRGMPIHQVGAFTGMDKTVNPNMDSKRKWTEDSWEDLLNGKQEAKPLEIQPTDL